MSIYQLMLPSALFWHSWHDLLEIGFLSMGIYGVSYWLKQDRRKPLLLYVYGYSLLILGSYYAQLSTLYTVLIGFAPYVTLFFILIHETTLQKNFVALKQIPSHNTITGDWLASLFKTALCAINNKKKITCIIEHTDAIAPFVTASLPLNAAVQEELLDLLFSSVTYDTQKMIWLTSQARIRGINALITHTAPHRITPTSTYTHDQETVDQACFLTTKTDACIITFIPEIHKVTLIVQGNVWHEISTHNALILLRKYFKKSLPSTLQGAYHHAHKPLKKTTYRQPTP